MKLQWYKKSDNIVKWINNYMELLNKAFLILLFIMLVCIWASDLIKNTLVTININIEIIKIISIYLHLSIKVFLMLFVIHIIILVVYLVIRKIYVGVYLKNQKYRYSEMLKSKNIDQNTKELYKNIYNYFNDKNNNIPIFINGEWGTGKTYTINNFLNEYYKYSKQKVYEVSCFGITTKEILMQRIEKECENKETGFSNQIINIIGEFPIIGSFLKNILEKKYEINSIERNSIFIFDNFERIECATYEYSIVKKENIESSINKYDIVVGVIDELIEKYHMKVIIIGNEKEMVPDYVYKTFICKLGCKKYTIIPKGKVFEELWKEIISKEINTKKYSDKFNSLLDKISLQTQIIWSISNNKNIRVLHKITYNYIQYMIFLYETNYQFKEEINEEISIYYTNLIINLFNNIDIRAYENIGIYYGKKAKRSNNTRFIGLDTIDAMWCSNRNINQLFINLEQNHENLLLVEKNFLKNFSDYYVSKKNCDKNNLNLKKIDFEDVAYLLVFTKESCLNNIYKWFESEIIDFSNPDKIVEIIDIYELDEIFIKNNILIYNLFEKNKKGEESIFLKESTRLSMKSERFKKILEKYKQINRRN